MADIAEIAPDVYRISIFIPDFNLQFNHFLVQDDQPLLFHTGLRGTFPEVRDGVARIIDPARLRWIAFSHRVRRVRRSQPVARRRARR